MITLRKLLKTFAVIVAAPCGIWVVYVLLARLAHTYVHTVAGYDGSLSALVLVYMRQLGTSFAADQVHTGVLSFASTGLLLSVCIVALAARAIRKIWK